MKHIRFHSVPPGRIVIHLDKSPKLMEGEIQHPGSLHFEDTIL